MAGEAAAFLGFLYMFNRVDKYISELDSDITDTNWTSRQAQKEVFQLNFIFIYKCKT